MRGIPSPPASSDNSLSASFHPSRRLRSRHSYPGGADPPPVPTHHPLSSTPTPSLLRPMRSRCQAPDLFPVYVYIYMCVYVYITVHPFFHPFLDRSRGRLLLRRRLSAILPCARLRFGFHRLFGHLSGGGGPLIFLTRS